MLNFVQHYHAGLRLGPRGLTWSGIFTLLSLLSVFCVDFQKGKVVDIILNNGGPSIPMSFMSSKQVDSRAPKMYT